MEAASGQVPAALAAALADRYRLERELGAGGMATVYLAEDLKHHRRVALKVLRPDLAVTLGADRFVREIAIAAGLQHPHVLPLHDSGEAGGFLFYVMPYVEGMSLRDRLGKEGELPVHEAVRVLRDVADALAYSHKHGVVHRDIKPENVMLSGRHAVVTDFGVAKAVSEATGRQQLTTIGVALGTPAYMSPEQATADPHVDHRADIYALGAMAYELLTGRPPFIGGSPQQVLAAHVTETAEPVTKHRASIPPALAELIARCLEKKPADRPQSAEELIPLLEALLTPSGGLTPTSARLSAVRPLVKLGALRWLVGAAVVLTAVAIPLLNRVRHSGAVAAVPRTTVAVLPFENEGVDSTHAYLLGGMHEELLTQLAKVPALTVISRRSVLGYRGTNKSLRTIAQELQVGSVVEGSIQLVGNRLRVNVQLIDAATDAHVWAEHYDGGLDDAFAIESDVARQVAGAVGAVLSTEQSRQLVLAPTANAEAYHFYLRAREYYSRGLGDPSILLAAQLFDSAVVRDPKFALAWAELAKAHSRAYFQSYDRTPPRNANARRALEEATRLAPLAPETEEAKAWYSYWVGGDYARAATEFTTAMERGARSAEVQVGLGMSERRLGKWDSAMAALVRAQALDPRSSEIEVEVGISHFFARRYPDAISAFRQATTLAPDQHRAYGYLAAAFIARDETSDSAIAVLRQGASLIGDATFVNRSFDGNAITAVYWMLPEVFPGAFSRLTRRDLGPRLAAYYLCLAEWHGRNGRLGQRRAYGDSALALVPTLADALAFAGHANDAPARLESALKEQARRGDHRTWPQRLYSSARIFAMLGASDRALELLEEWALIPSEGSAGMVQLDPAFKALRKEPRFLAVVGAARAR